MKNPITPPKIFELQDSWESQVLTFREEFYKHANKQHDMRLGPHQFKKFMKIFHCEDCSSQLFNFVDSNQDKRIDINEFLGFCEHLWRFTKTGDATSYVSFIFNALDQKHEGNLNKDQLWMFLSFFGIKTHTWNIIIRGNLLKEVDINGDEKISFDEILNFVNRKYDFIN